MNLASTAFSREQSVETFQARFIPVLRCKTCHWLLLPFRGDIQPRKIPLGLLQKGVLYLGGRGGGGLFRIIDNRAIVGHSVPQFMTLFHTETCDFPHPFSHPASRGDGEEWKKETNWEERVGDAWYKKPLLFISANPGVGKFLIG